jgi:hypothetical protein
MRYPGIVAVALLLFVLEAGLNVAFPETPSANADKPTDVKYYLIWQVTAPKIEVGAEVRVEPLVLTNGSEFVFVYDFCRQRFLDAHPDHRARRFYNVNVSARLNPEQFGEGTKALFEYCDGRPITLDGPSYHLRNNHGFSIGIGQVRFSLLEEWVRKAYRDPVFPDNGKGMITKIQGTVAPQYPAAVLAKQPYIFLMSRNAPLLNRIVPSPQPTTQEQSSLQVQLDRYRELRAKGGPTDPPVNTCKSWEDGTLVTRFMGRDDHLRAPKPLPVYPNLEPPPIADLFFDDLDRDGKMDLVAMLRESQLNASDRSFDKKLSPLLRVSQGVVRVFYGNGKERCPLRYYSITSASRPAILVKLGSCDFLCMNRHDDPDDDPEYDLVPVFGSIGSCTPTYINRRLIENVR